jgi:transcriptional regulator with XRE-family HTH domain
MARAALRWTTQQLAEAADVGVNTINRFEGGGDARLSSVEKVKEALLVGGIEFIAENGGGPGVRLAKGKKGRR